MIIYLDRELALARTFTLEEDDFCSDHPKRRGKNETGQHIFDLRDAEGVCADGRAAGLTVLMRNSWPKR